MKGRDVMNTVLVVLAVLVVISFVTGICLTIYEKIHMFFNNVPSNIIIDDDIEILEVDEFGIDFCDAEII